MEFLAEQDANRNRGMQSRVQQVGEIVLRYGLVLVIAWMALMKFSGVEAKGIQPLVAQSPLLGWMYSFLSVQAFSNGLGAVELAIALLIALRAWSSKASVLGSLGAVFMFLTTLTFLFSAAAWDKNLGGFPALSTAVGEFVIKDVVLLGAALWSLAEAWMAVIERAPSARVRALRVGHATV